MLSGTDSAGALMQPIGVQWRSRLLGWRWCPTTNETFHGRRLFDTTSLCTRPRSPVGVRLRGSRCRHRGRKQYQTGYEALERRTATPHAERVISRRGE